MSSPLCPDTQVCMAYDPAVIYPKWQTELMTALAETDPSNLVERVKEAEKAISKRFGRISRSTSHAAEFEAIERAMDALEAPRRKVNVRPDTPLKGRIRSQRDFAT